MRLRRWGKKPKSRQHQQGDDVKTMEQDSAAASVKVAQIAPRRRRSFWRRIADNPNFGYQMAVILLSLGSSENVSLDRRIDAMTTQVTQLKGMAEAVTNAMQALHTVAELPRNIKRIIQ